MSAAGVSTAGVTAADVTAGTARLPGTRDAGLPGRVPRRNPEAEMSTVASFCRALLALAVAGLVLGQALAIADRALL